MTISSRPQRRRAALGVAAGLVAVLVGATNAVQDRTAHAQPGITELSPGEAYAARGFGVFMHYGLATFVGETPWSYDPHDVPATVYDPPDFDPDQWMRAIKASGAKYLVLTAKHHDGFAMWDTETTDYGVNHSSDPATDVVGEVVRAARAHGIEVAIYYSWWDKMEPGGNVLSGAPPSPEYIRYAKDQMRELLTNYGPIVGLWLDIPTGADLRDLADFIHGVSPRTAFIPNLRYVSDAEDVTSFEGPDLEMIPCDYQGKPAEQAYNVAGGPGWWEMTPDALPKRDVNVATSTLAYVNHLGATLSLNVSPGPTGQFSPGSVRLLEGIGDRLRGDNLLADAPTHASGAAQGHPAEHATDLLAKTHWRPPAGGSQPSLQVELPERRTINRTAVQFTGANAAASYTIQYKDAHGDWRIAHRGNAPDIPTQTDTFTPVTTSTLRIVLNDPADNAGIAEFKAYGGVDDTSTAAGYTAGWQPAELPDAFNGTVHRSKNTGAIASFAFSGTGVALHTSTGPNHGTARVSVDGGAPEVVDLYTPQLTRDTVTFRRGDLAPGPHTITVEVTGDSNDASAGAWVVVDRITPLRPLGAYVPGRLPDGRVAIDDTGDDCTGPSPITYTGPWRASTWAGAFNGTRHVDYHPGSFAELSFQGTGIAVVTQTRPGHGIAAISLDGGPVERVDTYSDPAREQVVTWEKTGLERGPHTIRVTVTGDKNPASSGTWIGLDSFIITP